MGGLTKPWTFVPARPACESCVASLYFFDFLSVTSGSFRGIGAAGPFGPGAIIQGAFRHAGKMQAEGQDRGGYAGAATGDHRVSRAIHARLGEARAQRRRQVSIVRPAWSRSEAGRLMASQGMWPLGRPGARLRAPMPSKRAGRPRIQYQLGVASCQVMPSCRPGRECAMRGSPARTPMARPAPDRRFRCRPPNARQPGRPPSSTATWSWPNSAEHPPGAGCGENAFLVVHRPPGRALPMPMRSDQALRSGPAVGIICGKSGFGVRHDWSMSKNRAPGIWPACEVQRSGVLPLGRQVETGIQHAQPRRAQPFGEPFGS